ncbi:hypothetical protein Tco_0201053 [Tanacetum coccineum]
MDSYERLDIPEEDMHHPSGEAICTLLLHQLGTDSGLVKLESWSRGRIPGTRLEAGRGEDCYTPFLMLDNSRELDLRVLCDVVRGERRNAYEDSVEGGYGQEYLRV